MRTSHARAGAVVHRTPTRMRIRVPKRLTREPHASLLERIFLENGDVLKVEFRPVTGSVILHGRRPFDLTTKQRLCLGLARPEQRLIRPVSQGREAVPKWDAPSSALTFAAISYKLAVAVATKQVGPQLIEWLIECFIHAGKRRLGPGRSAS